MRTIKTYRKVGAFYIAWEEDLSTVIDETKLNCPLLHRFSGSSFGSINVESQQGNELRVSPESQ